LTLPALFSNHFIIQIIHNTPFSYHHLPEGESMLRMIFFVCIFISCSISAAAGQENFQKDLIPVPGGDLEVTFIGHGTLMLHYEGKIIHVDPYSTLADYSKLPKADIIFITHHHRDHLDPAALKLVRTDKTILVLTEICARTIEDGIIMKNGDVQVIAGIPVEAVPAYNLVHKRDNGEFFHPKGEGNGYIMTFGNIRFYVAGDTENTPEMKGLKNIDYAFLPMNLPYTMTPEMVADAAGSFKPKVLYPYHYGETDTARVITLLKDHPEVEVRIRSMK
jgi:L-ascorbate metabolism protein UlaG (beta-lactamase superfamily)